jgi:hypothetical protein
VSRGCSATLGLVEWKPVGRSRRNGGCLIERDQLSPTQVASLFAIAASERATKDGATVILAAVTARFNTCRERESFNGDLERDLALWLLDGSSFDAANKQAVKIVQRHWHEIQKGRSRSSGPSFSAYCQLGRDRGNKRGTSGDCRMLFSNAALIPPSFAHSLAPNKLDGT